MIAISKRSLNQIKLTKNDIIESAVQLVSSNAKPFSFLNDSGFKIIMDSIGRDKYSFI